LPFVNLEKLDLIAELRLDNFQMLIKKTLKLVKQEEIDG